MDQAANRVPRFTCARQYVCDLRPIRELNACTSSIDGQLLDKVTRQLFIIGEEQAFEFPNILKFASVGQFAARIDSRAQPEMEKQPVVAAAFDRLTTTNGPVATTLAAHDIERFEREARRIDVAMASRAGFLRA